MFTNLNVWLRRQLDSHICFCIPSVVMSHIIEFLDNSTVPPGRIRVKRAIKMLLTSQNPLKHGIPAPVLRTAALDQ